MTRSEKTFIKFHNKNDKKGLRINFLNKQAMFDKLLRKTERTYNRQLADKIEDLNTNNPTEFWNNIKNLGPQKSKNIPMKVYNDDGSLMHDTASVLDKWKSDFQGLYNKPESHNVHFDNDFYESVKARLPALEGDPTISNQAETLNNDFKLDEMNRLCMKIKTGKAMGPDGAADGE